MSPRPVIVLLVSIAALALTCWYCWQMQPITTEKVVLGSVCAIESHYLKLEDSPNHFQEISNIRNLNPYVFGFKMAQAQKKRIKVFYRETIHPVSGYLSQEITKIEEFYPTKK